MNYYYGGDIKLRRIRRHLRFLGVLLSAAAIFAAMNVPDFVSASASLRDLPIYSVETKDKKAALTFDAAWGDGDTDELIEIFEKYGVRATFFTVGEWARRCPQSLVKLAGAGHEIANHSDDHAHMNKLTASETAENIRKCSREIAGLTGTAPKLFRAPYGEYDDHVVAAARSCGLLTIQWDVDSLDWKGLSASEIYDRVTGKVHPGSIILFHNDAAHTTEALPGIIEYLLAEGYEIVPVGELIYEDDYTIDHAGRQYSNN